MAEWWEYPKAKYHSKEPPRVVHSAAEDAALDPREWFDHPDKAKNSPTLEEKLEHEDYLAENPPKVFTPAERLEDLQNPRVRRPKRYDGK